jgi:hypothetical protein
MSGGVFSDCGGAGVYTGEICDAENGGVVTAQKLDGYSEGGPLAPPVTSVGAEVDCVRMTMPASSLAAEYLVLATALFEGDVAGTAYTARIYLNAAVVGSDQIKGDDGQELVTAHTLLTLAPGDDLAITMQKTGGAGASTCYTARLTAFCFTDLLP